ncbi:MAG: tetratricopeptide repeat protein [Caldilinea sp. CFX5]|nr:tetratricopeptide repeat protein [Caldilinea sp. CFX5]
MPNRLKKSEDSQNNSSWLLRLFRRIRSKKTGDVISAEIGDNARGNAIGKYIFQNYIQIGTVVIPTWLIVGMTLFLLLAIPVILVRSAALGREIYQWAVGPIYDPMENIFRIAVTDIAVTGGSVSESAVEAAGTLADLLFEEVNEAIKESEIEKFTDLRHLSKGVENIKDLAALDVRIADIAEQLRADVVIYGSLDVVHQRYVPAFYINPRLTGAEESTGDHAFGSPIHIPLPLTTDPVGRFALLDEFYPRVQALAEFMAALAFFKTGDYDAALKQLEQVQSIEGWQDKEGKEILYLWIGSTYFRRSLRGQSPADFSCLVPDSAATDDLGCTQDAYMKANALHESRTAGGQYARAHIGLGNYWLMQDWTERNGQRVLRCAAYDLALQEYEQALAAAPTADKRSFAELKVHYNKGTAFATGYRNGCEPQNVFYEGAIAAFVKTIETYKRDPHGWVARDISARASYQLGVVYNLAGIYESAIEAFLQVLTISEEPQGESEAWQAIYWKAYVQLGHVYLTLARAGPKPWWQTLGGLRADWRQALASYSVVINAKNNLQFGREEGRDQENEIVFVADAYYGKGAVYNLRGEYAKAEESLRESIQLVEEQVDLELRSTLVSLPWVSYIELGRTYAGQERWTNALAAYDVVIAARNNQQRVKLDLLAAAYFGAAEIYHRQGDRVAAINYYTTVIDLVGETDPLTLQARHALLQLDKQ